MIKNIDKIIPALKKEYKNDISMLGSFSKEKKDPFFILISTVLSARAKDETTQPLSIELFKKYKTPEDFVNVPVKKLEMMIKRSGFYHEKAKRIKEISRVLIEQYDGNVPNTMEELLFLPGVGKKTAGCVMVYAFGKNEIPVDIHVEVISRRLGWTKEKTPDKINEDLKNKIPMKYWLDINELLVLHGKKICQTRVPFCSKCVISGYCQKIGIKKSK